MSLIEECSVCCESWGHCWSWLQSKPAECCTLAACPRRRHWTAAVGPFTKRGGRRAVLIFQAVLLLKIPTVKCLLTGVLIATLLTLLYHTSSLCDISVVTQPLHSNLPGYLKSACVRAQAVHWWLHILLQTLRIYSKILVLVISVMAVAGVLRVIRLPRIIHFIV